jgi:hypothetical protein
VHALLDEILQPAPGYEAIAGSWPLAFDAVEY